MNKLQWGILSGLSIFVSITGVVVAAHGYFVGVIMTVIAAIGSTIAFIQRRKLK